MSAPLNGSHRLLGHVWFRHDFVGMPSVALLRRQHEDRGWFVVVDPAACWRIRTDGHVSTDGLNKRTIFVVIAISVSFCTVLGLSTSIDSSHPRLSVSAVLGLALGGITVMVANAALDQRRHMACTRAGIPLSWNVGPGDGRARRLCEIAAQISQCQAWRNGTVDAGRQVPAILWSAVGRALTLEQRRRDAERALRHDSLRELAQHTLLTTKRELGSLGLVEDNLNRVLVIAWSLSERPAQLARDAEARRRRKAEEQELRARLSYSFIADPVQESDEQADRSAGLLAEVTVVSELLAASDRMLRNNDSVE